MKYNHEKGYNTFFKTLFMLSLMKYIFEHSNNNLSLFIYDSPLKGFLLSKEIVNKNNIRIGYFNYLFNLETDNQIIVMETLNNKDINKKEFINLSGVSSSSIAKLTEGQNVTTDVLCKICKSLNRDFTDIMKYISE